MSKKWEQVGGDVNPKDHGAVLAKLDDSSVDVVRIEPNEEGPGWHVDSATFHASDLEWGGQAHPESMADTMGFDRGEWEETKLATQGAIAMQYHGSGWSGDYKLVTKWSQALPAKSNQIKWWK
jgi:hypothetical protein